MKETIRYIKDILGDNLSTISIPKKLINTLPFYIASEYKFLEVILFDTKIILAKGIFLGHLTPSQYKKRLNILEKAFNEIVVFVLPDIEPYNRNRLIKDRINFVIADKQVFIPSLIIDLKEYKLNKAPQNHLQPAAQLLILYHLQVKELNNYNYKQLEAITDYSYLTISRAIENLSAFELCKVKGNKEKKVYFDKKNKEFWGEALRYMKNPVIKYLFTDEQLPDNQIYRTNINALAYYTNLNDENQNYIAISKDLYKNLNKTDRLKKSSDYDGQYYVEVWNYNPAILSKNGIVDPLSLYLSFKESEDERIQMALEDIIKQQKW